MTAGRHPFVVEKNEKEIKKLQESTSCLIEQNSGIIIDLHMKATKIYQKNNETRITMTDNDEDIFCRRRLPIYKNIDSNLEELATYYSKIPITNVSNKIIMNAYK